MVQVLFRHGIRYSLYSELLKNLENFEENQQKEGQLNALGMRQMYILGTFFRQIYIQDLSFLSEKYNS